MIVKSVRLAMGKATEALDKIAGIRGCSPTEARAFCQEVQSHCVIPPSFSTIASVLQRYGHANVPMETVALEASQFQGGSTANVLPAADHPIPESAPPEKISSIYKADLTDE